MRSKIFFRFETDFNIGLGHAIRSLRVANFLKKKNFIVNIITSKKSYNILKTLKVGNIKIILIDRTTKLINILTMKKYIFLKIIII